MDVVESVMIDVLMTGRVLFPRRVGSIGMAFCTALYPLLLV